MLGHILAVKDRHAALGHHLVVHLGVGRGDDDQIIGFDGLRRQRLQALIPLAFMTVLGDKGIIEIRHGPRFMELLDDPDGGALPVVVDILLVGHAQHQHVGPVQNHL